MTLRKEIREIIVELIPYPALPSYHEMDEAVDAILAAVERALPETQPDYKQVDYNLRVKDEYVVGYNEAITEMQSKLKENDNE